MYEPQHFVDLQDNAAGGFGGDPDSWLSGEDQPPSASIRRTLSSFSAAAASAGGAAGNVDRVLFNDLVEIVPLVQSLIDRKANTSFTRRGSIAYTKTPSRESLLKKTTETKGRYAAQSIPTKKRRDLGDKELGKNTSDNRGDSFSIFSSSVLPAEKDGDELLALREQVEDLQRKLSEKDELLESAEKEMTSVRAKLDEAKHQASEKDSVLKTTQSQLSDAKIKLADKQAALEKLQWEATTSKGKVEKLQEDLNTMQEEMSSFVLLFEGLTKKNDTGFAEDIDVTVSDVDHFSEIDDLDERDMRNIEEAQEAYVAALATAKEHQDEESSAMAASARLHLQSFVLKTQSWEAPSGNHYVVIHRVAAETLAH
ncbi:hypothetical protein RJ639_021841 [Escallonia herrerae]|uniref:Movement protein binding protein 2C n=1 Tax=Escallonia herrerae TaxID=1293975 RepID=A0AA88V305_9ASTE|nr:hypothetical protein RJ639_021841 [Escallonia herrerae]